MRSTGPIIATGAITLANASILHGKPVDWRIPVATAIAAGAFALAEHAAPDIIGPLAWLGLFTALFVRVDPRVPTPVETFLEYWQRGSS